MKDTIRKRNHNEYTGCREAVKPCRDYRKLKITLLRTFVGQQKNQTCHGRLRPADLFWLRSRPVRNTIFMIRRHPHG